MKKIGIHLLKKILFITIPFGGLYIFAQMAFEENRKSRHPKDVGLGIAILLFLILLILFIIFFIDAIKQYKKKEYKLMGITIFFLLLFSIPILKIHCLMGGDTFFCDTLISTTKGWFID